MKVPFFSPWKEFGLHEEEYTRVWKDVRRRGDLILRRDVEEFEKAFAEYVGVKYCVGVNSGTDALFIALKALGIKEKDLVLVPSHTFVATVQVVQQISAIPILYDIGQKLEITEDYKAIIVAHIAGEFMCDMDEVIKCGIPVIEDSAQALGATQNGKKAGSFGKAGAFSFYPAKILGGPGDGGALVTDDEKIYEFAKAYRNHWKKDYSQWGINSRLSNVIAAELLVKLKRIDKTLARREKIAQMYIDGIIANINTTDLENGDIAITNKIILPKEIEGRVWQDFCIRTEKWDELYNFLKENGIETMKNEYPMPCGKLPNTAKYEAETLRLPINEVITDEEVNYVIEKINEFYESKR